MFLTENNLVYLYYPTQALKLIAKCSFPHKALVAEQSFLGLGYWNRLMKSQNYFEVLLGFTDDMRERPLFVFWFCSIQHTLF